jgi:hypothetical protein
MPVHIGPQDWEAIKNIFAPLHEQQAIRNGLTRLVVSPSGERVWRSRPPRTWIKPVLWEKKTLPAWWLHYFATQPTLGCQPTTCVLCLTVVQAIALMDASECPSHQFRDDCDRCSRHQELITWNKAWMFMPTLISLHSTHLELITRIGNSRSAAAVVEVVEAISPEAPKGALPRSICTERSPRTRLSGFSQLKAAVERAEVSRAALPAPPPRSPEPSSQCAYTQDTPSGVMGTPERPPDPRTPPVPAIAAVTQSPPPDPTPTLLPVTTPADPPDWCRMLNPLVQDRNVPDKPFQ